MSKFHFLICCPVIVILVAGSGCGGHADASSQSFDSAPADIKADWELAVAADKTNGYYVASTAYARVLSQESHLTPKQLSVLESASRDLSQRMVTAANSGDESAKQALARLMSEQNRR